jgi:hypothetical protein
MAGVKHLQGKGLDCAGAEADAKACLVQYLRAQGRITARCAIALELSVAKQANRADMAVIGNKISVYEIKTHKDNLARLDNQIKSYDAIADHLTVVAATPHISTIITRVPQHVGILEITRFGGISKIRHVRDAQTSPNWQASSILSLLPATEIRDRLLGGVGPKRRADLLLAAELLPREKLHKTVTRFLRERYHRSTAEFLRDVKRRNVTPQDLATLSIWINRGSPPVEAEGPKTPIDNDGYLSHVGRSFGPVPDDVSVLLKG